MYPFIKLLFKRFYKKIRRKTEDRKDNHETIIIWDECK